MRAGRLQGLFYLAVCGMELSFLYVAVSLLGAPAYVVGLILFLYLVAFVPRIGTSRFSCPDRLFPALEIALVAIIILLVMAERAVGSLASGQVDVFGIIVRTVFCGAAWWLGHTVPCDGPDYSAISRRFQIGVLALLMFAPFAGSVAPVFLFFLLASLALLLARWVNAFERGAAVLRPPAFGHLLLAAASTVVPGSVLVLVLSPDVARALVGGIGNIFAWLSVFAGETKTAAAPREYAFPFSCNFKPEGEGGPTGLPKPTAEGVAGTSPVVIWAFVFAIFIAVMVFIALALQNRQKRNARQIPALKFEMGKLTLGTLRGLILFFPRQLKRLWLYWVALVRRLANRSKSLEEPPVSVRALYRNLLRWAERRGIARGASHTPLEHLAKLGETFPRQQDDLKEITRSYLVARYSRKPTSPEEFDRVKQAWLRLAALRARSRAKA